MVLSLHLLVVQNSKTWRVLEKSSTRTPLVFHVKFDVEFKFVLKNHIYNFTTRKNDIFRQ